MTFSLRPMLIEDYDPVHALWLATEYMLLNECDSREGIAFYLNRNPGLCFVAEQNGEIVGTILSGQDGRRGYVHHLAVAKAHRSQGIARALVQSAMQGLTAHGIGKCNLYVEDKNTPGLDFWRRMGWETLDYTFRVMQRPV